MSIRPETISAMRINGLSDKQRDHVTTIDALLSLAGMELFLLAWDIPAQVCYRGRTQTLFMMGISHPLSVWQSTLAEYLADPDAFYARRGPKKRNAAGLPIA